MQTLTMDIEVKHYEEMSPEEQRTLLYDTLDNGKAGLLVYVWHMTHELSNGKDIYQTYNLYIRSDEDAKVFLENFFDGNIEDFEGHMERYLEWLYSQQ